ncbi:MAG: DUF86 domain-containing protein [Methylococcaceae bacterium]
MQFEVYQRETEQIARQQTSLLDEASTLLNSGKTLTGLEQNGVLHALQVLIENAIGKAKHLLKAAEVPVPISAYDTFAELIKQGYIPEHQKNQWNAIIGLRNKIVHDYMNINIETVLDLVRQNAYQPITHFLLNKDVISSRT